MSHTPKRAALRASAAGPPPPPESLRRWIPSTWTEIDSVRLSVAAASISDHIRSLYAEALALEKGALDFAERKADINSRLKKAYNEQRKLSGFDRAFIEATIRKYARLRA